MTLEQAIKKLPKYRIEIGVIAGKSKRDKDTKGVTNAELMFIHENGSPLNNIPPRPVLAMTINHAHEGDLKNALDKATKAFVDSNFDENAMSKELQKFCLELENYARDIIYSNDGRLAPNSESVAAKKREKAIRNARTVADRQAAMQDSGNHPLFDTGQLARSITCQLVKIYK